METNFNKKLIILITSLVIVSILLAVINFFVKPHVVSFQINGNSKFAEVSQKIKVSFSRPMNKSTLSDIVTIEPKADFTLNWLDNNLYIYANNLNYKTKYQVTLTNKVLDKYNNPIDEYKFEFTTKEERYAYINRTNTDKLVVKNIEGDTLAFEDFSTIRKIKSAGENILIVARVNRYDSLILFNIETKKRDIIKDGQIEVIDFDYMDGKVLYVYQEVEAKEGYLKRTSEQKISEYYIVSDTNKQIKLKENSELLELKYIQPNTFLYKISDGGYIIEDNTNNTAVNLGKFLSINQVSQDGTKLVGVTYDPTSVGLFQYVFVQDSERKVLKVTDSEQPVIDPIFLDSTYNKIIFSQRYQDVDLTKGIFNIVEYDGSEIKTVLQVNGFSLELPKVSYNARYLSAEKYSIESLTSFDSLRNYGFQTKPFSGDLVIYDLQESKTLETIENAVEFQWIK